MPTPRVVHYCRHYDGRATLEPNAVCSAGVRYDSFGEESFGRALRRPCIQGMDRKGREELPCAQRCMPTPEEEVRERAKLDAASNNVIVALRIARKWRTASAPAKDRAEVVECPVCKGKLHLRQSAQNGHVHGRCETPGCVSWME